MSEDKGAVLPPKRVAERRADAVTGELSRLIQSGGLAEGARLPPERDLMRRFGVSRAAIREAIAALAGRGFIEARLGHRPVVRNPGYGAAILTLDGLAERLVEGRSGVWNLFESRIFLEAALARAAARQARREDIAELRARLADNRSAVGDSKRFDETDVAFHAVLYRIPGNPIYPAVHKAYVDWLTRHWRSMPRGSDVDRMNHAGHQAIFEAVEARDADGAEEALKRHLLAGWEFVRSTFPEAQEALAPSQAPEAAAR